MPPWDHKILIPKSKPGTANANKVKPDAGSVGKIGADNYGNNVLKKIGADKVGVIYHNDKIVGKDSPCSTRNTNYGVMPPGVGGYSKSNGRRKSGSFKCPRIDLTSAGGVVSNEQACRVCTVDLDTEFDDGRI